MRRSEGGYSAQCAQSVRPALVAVLFVVVAVFSTSCSSDGHKPAPSPSFPSSWHPKSPITHVKLSESEKRRLRDQYLKALAKVSKIRNPPRVELVRWATIDDVGPVLAECYTDSGFPSKAAIGVPGVEPEGGVAPDQLSAFNLVDYRCQGQYTLDPTYTRDWTDEQKGLVYDYYVEFLVPCLTGVGYTFDPAPSRAVFVAKFPSVDWNPSLKVQSSITAEQNEQCPLRPPSEDMYG